MAADQRYKNTTAIAAKPSSVSALHLFSHRTSAHSKVIDNTHSDNTVLAHTKRLLWITFTHRIFVKHELL